jgi:hypothetical protein
MEIIGLETPGANDPLRRNAPSSGGDPAAGIVEVDAVGR